MEISNQLVSEIKEYLSKRPLIEVYSLFTRLTLAEAEMRSAVQHILEVPDESKGEK